MFERRQLSDHYDGFARRDSGSWLRCRFAPAAEYANSKNGNRIPQGPTCGIRGLPALWWATRRTSVRPFPITVLHPGSPATSDVRSGSGTSPSRESVRGGWIIGSSKNDPPVGRLHYSSGEVDRPAGAREPGWSIRPIRSRAEPSNRPLTLGEDTCKRPRGPEFLLDQRPQKRRRLRKSHNREDEINVRYDHA